MIFKLLGYLLILCSSHAIYAEEQPNLNGDELVEVNSYQASNITSSSVSSDNVAEKSVAAELLKTFNTGVFEGVWIGFPDSEQVKNILPSSLVVSSLYSGIPFALSSIGARDNATISKFIKWIASHSTRMAIMKVPKGQTAWTISNYLIRVPTGVFGSFAGEYTANLFKNNVGVNNSFILNEMDFGVSATVREGLRELAKTIMQKEHYFDLKSLSRDEIGGDLTAGATCWIIEQLLQNGKPEYITPVAGAVEVILVYFIAKGTLNHHIGIPIVIVIFKPTLDLFPNEQKEWIAENQQGLMVIFSSLTHAAFGSYLIPATLIGSSIPIPTTTDNAIYATTSVIAASTAVGSGLWYAGKLNHANSYGPAVLLGIFIYGARTLLLIQ